MNAQVEEGLIPGHAQVDTVSVALVSRYTVTPL